MRTSCFLAPYRIGCEDEFDLPAMKGFAGEGNTAIILSSQSDITKVKIVSSLLRRAGTLLRRACSYSLLPSASENILTDWSIFAIVVR